jgi:hypothetical protein
LRGLGRARLRKKDRLTALIHHLNVDTLWTAFYALRRKAAPGVDGMTWQDYEKDLEPRLADLHKRVQRGAYRPQPSRRTYIPKADGKQRPLAIATLEDKIVQGATVIVLTLEDGIVTVDDRGTGQGSVISPLLETSTCTTFSTCGPSVGDSARPPATWSSCAMPLHEIKDELRRRMHWPLPEQGKWLRQVVAGHFAYFAVPTNFRATSTFRHHVLDLWRRALQRRSQRDHTTWARIDRISDTWLPKPRIPHPWPEVRFAVKHPR